MTCVIFAKQKVIEFFLKLILLAYGTNLALAGSFLFLRQKLVQNFPRYLLKIKTIKMRLSENQKFENSMFREISNSEKRKKSFALQI